MAACGSRIVENVSSSRHQRFFCDLSETTTKKLGAIEIAIHCPRGAHIYSESQPCQGIFVVCAGRVKLSATSPDGGMMILKFPGPGEVLGLSETITGRSYETRATATESCQLNFIPRADFLSLLNQHNDAAAQVIRKLSDSYLSLIDNMREIGLTRSASKKLARFLLHWHEINGGSARLNVTHEEIAQSIGSSRETVTRLFSAFKKKHLIRLNGSLLLITDSAALQNHAAWLPEEPRQAASRQLSPHTATAR